MSEEFDPTAPPLGFIVPSARTSEQNEAHAKAMALIPKFAMPAYTDPPVGTKVMLTDFWKTPEVIADVGQEFTGYGQYTGSCFPAGTPVRMADGSEKPIESVIVGDFVPSHTGQLRRVTKTFSRPFTGDMITVHVGGFPFPLEMTEDHKVAISVGDEIEWKRADELEVNDRVLIGWQRYQSAPESLDTAKLLGDKCIVLDELMKDGAYTKGNEPDVPNSNFNSARRMVKQSGIDWKGRVRLHHTRVDNSIFRNVPVCPSLGRLIGIYLAEGGCHEGRVSFTFHEKERDTLAAEVLSLVRGLFGVEGEYEQQNSRPNTCKIRFQNQNLAEVFKSLIPGNIYTKRVPGMFFTADEETRLAVLLGWMAGDGYVGVKGGKNPGNVRITGVSVCAGLARDMTTLALSCGVKASTNKRKARGASKPAYDVNLSGKKAVSLFPAVAHRANGPRYTDIDKAARAFSYSRPVTCIVTRAVETLPVYDFEVEEDHSFVAGGLVVHNCVGVSEGNAVNTVGMVQRMIADAPTKAFLCWWPFAYGRTRYNEGDRGQGEGAVDSIMGKTLVEEGFFDTTVPGAPTFTKTGPDGFWLTKQTEYQWSDGGSSLVTNWIPEAKKRAGMHKSVCNNTQDIRAAIINGYPILDGCANYVGSGEITSGGGTPYVRGRYDGQGGHSTCFLGAWNHPNDGWLYLYSNQWPTSTYPKDPAGGGRCCVWLPESEVTKLFRTGGDNGETMALSHVPGTPLQPKVLIDWSTV